MSVLLRMSFAAGLALSSGCATVGTQTGADTAGAARAPAGGVSARATAGWAVSTRQHVDLWLHGYALLQRDTARVPFFRRGYRDRVLAERRQRGVTTALDLNRDRLEARLAANPALVNGQFVPLYFASFDELRRAVDLFLRVEGEPRAAGSQEGAFYVALLASSFPSAADREWVRLFVQSLVEETTASTGSSGRPPSARKVRRSRPSKGSGATRTRRSFSAS